MKPLAADLCCGLGGWTEGLQAEGYDVIGFDIERHVYGEERYPGQLVVQDLLTIHGRQLRDFALIVASPPCQFFSYTAMPWSIAKERARRTRADPDLLATELALFNACFRIQREAIEAAGHHIPMVVENVRGAIPWVGRSRWNFGSYHLWGDVPALMPPTVKGVKVSGHSMSQGAPKWNMHHTECVAAAEGLKVPGFRFDGSKRSFQTASVNTMNGADPYLPEREGLKHGGDWFSDPSSPSRQGGQVKTVSEGRKGTGTGTEWFDGNLCVKSSNSPDRKRASAMIAKIPEPLARHIARVYHP